MVDGRMIRGTLILLHLVLVLTALGAGQALARRPSGEDLAFETDWLEGSPFRDYRIPGLFMVLVIAPANLLALAGQVGRKGAAPYLSVGCGALLVGWLVIQTAIIGYRHWSQLIWAVIFPLTGVLGLVQMGRRQHE